MGGVVQWLIGPFPRSVDECLRDTGYIVLVREEPATMRIFSRFDPKKGMQEPISSINYHPETHSVTIEGAANLDERLATYIMEIAAKIGVPDQPPTFYAAFEELIIRSGRFL